MASTVALGAPFSAYAREKLLDNSAVFSYAKPIDVYWES